ncbi:hypothetical protein [Lactobacillus helveticus]|uniref:hypothetical protein n=1 Tax=Lactobacillus helveticus TaxID=1587 RepID=UPI000CA3B16A|nr:hypothetical protein [Lactobacillus helveticus]AUJ28727.1 hypothetical protein Lh8627_10300 [Lactobacillus helveticus]
MSGEKAFAVICTNTNKKADVTSIFILLGHYLQAKNGIILNRLRLFLFFQKLKIKVKRKSQNH